MATCSVCGSKAKSEKTFAQSRHIISKKHQAALGKMESPTSPPRQQQVRGNNLILQRLSSLETQNKMILERLLALESHIRSSSSRSTQSQSANARSEIRSFLLRNLSRGKSINVDRIAEKTKKYRWQVVENIISDMVDEEIFDIAEANSTHKVLGRYGMIIRRWINE